MEQSELYSLTTQYGKMEQHMGEGGENKIITTIKKLITMLCQMLPSLYPLHSTYISVLPFLLDTQTSNLLSCKH